MKTKIKIRLINTLLAILLFMVPVVNYAQAPNLGSAAGFVLFTTVGAITNTGPSQITGHVGSNSGAATGFGNVNGSMYSSNAITALCAADLLTAYGQLNTTIPGFFPASPLGNTSTLTAGVYSLSGNTVLSNTLTLNAAGTPSAVFIFLINGTFASNANAQIVLTNGAQACNVFWKVEGAVGLASGTTMRGTIIANNAAISISASVTLEGRALTTSGAITINQTFAYTPIGCGSPFLTGPAAPNLASTACYGIFSSNGPVSNAGVTTVTGDIGSNNGLTTGFNPLLVTGTIHPIPDISTAQCSLDLGNVYTYLNGLPADIILLYPAQFGNNLVLTPHIYVMNGAVSLTDSLYLNAQGNPNAVFVIQVNGAFTTNSGAKIILINGTQSKNVFWKIDGALSIATNAKFKGTFVVNNGAILLATGVNLDGRIMTTTGAVGITASTVSIPPIIGGTTSVPDQTVCAGTTVSLTLGASGATSYQWRKGTTNLVNGGSISGVTSATLVIAPVSTTDAATNYNVIIAGGCGASFTTANITLVVNASPSISAVVPSQTVCAGSPVTFSVAGTGAGLSYQWRNGLVNLVNTATVSGVNTATLTINPVNVGDASSNYNLVITGSCSPNFTTPNISLVVNTSPSITGMPLSQTVCAGSAVNFSVLAAGSGLTYQWRNGLINMVNGGSVSGATSSVLVINPVVSANASLVYNVIVSGFCTPNFTSANVSLVVNSSPSITAQSLSQTVCAGSAVIFTVAATGTGLIYQWRNGLVNLVNNATVTGVSTATLGINPVSLTDASVNYNVVVSGSCSPAFTSANIGLVVNSSPTITAAVPDQTVCAGSPVIFSVSALGTGLTYQWRKGSVNLVNGGAISGATTATLSINPVAATDASTLYNVVISGVCAPNFTSANIALVVNSSPSITGQPVSQTVCVGSPVVFTVAATGTGLSYQWRNGTVAMVNGGSVSGATTATLSINPAGAANASANYNVIVTGVCAPGFTSVSVALVISSSATISAAVPDQTVCAGSSASFSVNASGTGLSYQWRNGTVNLLNAGNVSGATSATLVINPVGSTDASANYNLVISGACAPNYTSANIKLTVNSSPTISTLAVSQTVCAGSPAGFSVTASGSGLVYQWRNGTVNLVNGGNISGANSASLVINPVNISNSSSVYNLVVSGVCAPDYTSTNVGLTVNASPVFTAQIPSQTVCVGSAANFGVLASGTGLTYQWRNGTVNIANGGNISGATSATLTISPATVSNSATNYNVVITGVCAPAYTSANVELLVNLSIVANPGSNSPVCTGSLINLSVLAVSGATYSWSGPNSFTSGVQNPEIPSASAASAGLYSLTISTSNCISAPAMVTVLVKNCNDFFIPGGFSPNSDGINDLFVIRGILNFPDNSFVIFNRWGSKVYEAKGYQNTWDGTATEGIRLGGNELPVGTYFYVLDLGDGSPFYKGTIYLNR